MTVDTASHLKPHQSGPHSELFKLTCSTALSQKKGNIVSLTEGCAAGIATISDCQPLFFYPCRLLSNHNNICSGTSFAWRLWPHLIFLPCSLVKIRQNAPRTVESTILRLVPLNRSPLSQNVPYAAASQHRIFDQEDKRSQFSLF